MKTRPRILVITPVKHIRGVSETLESFAEVSYLDDPSPEEALRTIGEFDAVFTNPNKSKVFIGHELIDSGKNLKVICTASTGTNHIDKTYAAEKKLPILALTEERDVINRISSTAELAFTLTLSALRRLVPSHNNALKGEWDYTRYIGRQMNCLTIGVIGYGRLGSMYAHYAKAFGSRVLVFDPHKKVTDPSYEQVASVGDLLRQSDVIAIHVHVTPETLGMVDKTYFDQMKSDVLLVNTARGDIINEADAVEFLRKNPGARMAVDVLADEIRKRLESPLFKYAQKNDQVLLTQHIGGMTREAQEIAYGHAAKRLKEFFTLSR